MIKVNCTCGMVKAGCIPLWKITYEWCSSHTLAKSYCIILNPPPWVIVKQTRVVLNCLVVAGDDHSQPLRAEYCNLKYSLMTTCEPKFQLTTNVTTEIVMLTGGGILKFQRDNKTFLCISSQFHYDRLATEVWNSLNFLDSSQAGLVCIATWRRLVWLHMCYWWHYWEFESWSCLPEWVRAP